MKLKTALVIQKQLSKHQQSVGFKNIEKKTRKYVEPNDWTIFVIFGLPIKFNTHQKQYYSEFYKHLEDS